MIEDATYARNVLFQHVRYIVSPQVLFSEFLPPQLLAQGQEVSHKNHFQVLSKALLGLVFSFEFDPHVPSQNYDRLHEMAAQEWLLFIALNEDQE